MKEKEKLIYETAKGRHDKPFIDSEHGNIISDMDRFIALYKSVGIDLVVEEVPGRGDYNGGLSITIDDNCKKCDGYGGFFTSIIFDKSGKFISQGIWE